MKFSTLYVIYIPHGQQVVVDQRFCLQSDLAEQTEYLNVLRRVLVTVQTHTHQQVLGWPCQLEHIKQIARKGFDSISYTLQDC